MHQMKSQRNTADQIDDDKPRVREGVLPQQVQVEHLHSIIYLPIVRGFCNPCLYPEILKVDDQEEENERTEPTHISRIPLTSLVSHRHLVADVAFAAVL